MEHGTDEAVHDVHRLVAGAVPCPGPSAKPLLPTKVTQGTDEAGAQQRGARGHIETMKMVQSRVQQK